MPSKKRCKNMFPEGSKAYDDCVNYKGGFKKPAKKNPMGPAKGPKY